MITATTDMSAYPRVLAIDQAQHSGFAINDGRDGAIISWHKRIPLKNRESLFMDYVIQQLKLYRPEHVIFEDIRFSQNVDAGHCAGMWRGFILAACQIEGIPTSRVKPNVWKLHLTGHGGCKKPKKGSNEIYKVIAAVNRRGFASVTDDNEADALGILLYALETGVVEKA